MKKLFFSVLEMFFLFEETPNSSLSFAESCRIINPFFKKLIYIFLFLSSLNILGQELETKLLGNVSFKKYFKNPSISAFTDYSNQNLVDLYTGMLDINIPIYNVIDKDLRVPIILKYRKDGIKVNEYSGRTGLGWNIISGGYIIREVKGNPDEEIKAIHPTRGTEYYHNFGRFVDLMDLIHPNSILNYQMPLGNYGGNKSMDYYVNLLKNGNINDCLSPREIEYSGYFEELSRHDICEASLVSALKQTPHISSYTGASGEDNIIWFWNRYRDTQPDIFHYATPSASGSFILDEHGNPLVINGVEDVVIKPGIGPNANPEGWEIITNDGIICYFPTISSHTEISSNSKIQSKGLYRTGFGTAGRFYIGYEDENLTKEKFKNIPDYFDSRGPDDLYTLTRESVNTWYMSKMKSSKYKAEITFSYSEQQTIEEYNIEENKMDYINTTKKNYSQNVGDPGTKIGDEISHTKTVEYNPQYIENMAIYADPNRSYYFPILRSIKNPKYLTKISFKNGEINFLNQASPRLDMEGNYALDKITINNYNGKKVKEFKFEYDHFLELPYVNMKESSRLKLKTFYEVSNNKSLGKYSFEYNENNKLPSKNSKKQDYWGYFNNNTSNSLIPKGYRHGKSFSGADRSPNEEKMKTWMLKKITYPTGGSSDISYKINKYLDKEYNIEHSIGGLRVHRIITNDSNNIKNYLYSDGRTVHFLDTNWWRHFQSDSHFFHYLNRVLSDFMFIKRSSSNMFPMLKTNGGWVGYGKVTVEESTNGKTEYEFTNSKDFSNIQSNKIKYPFVTQNGSDFYHENTHISKSPMRGLLKSIWIRNNNNKSVYYEKNEYNINPQNYNQIKVNSMKIEPQYAKTVLTGFSLPIVTDTYLNHSLIEYAEIKSYFPFIKKTIKRKYNLDGIGYNEMTYEFKKESSSNMQITESSFINSEGDKSKIKRYYTNDNQPKRYLNIYEKSSIDKMKEQNRIEPILIEKYEENNLLTKQINIHKTLGEIVSLKTIQTSKGTAPLEDRIIYHKYDDKGNPLEVSKKGGLHSVFIWGYNQTKLIAKIENCTYDELMRYNYNSGKAILSSIYSAANNDNDRTVDTRDSLGNVIAYNGKEGKLREALQDLRSALSNTQVTTYTYDPLIGVTSMTDPKGYTIYYEYDEFNRLKQVKDADGNMLSKNQYNYKN